VGFDDLNLIPPILSAVRREGYTVATPIQRQAIPPVMAGRDLMGSAQTGTGKTAAFALPILQRLARRGQSGRRKRVRVLVLTPTRELAVQVGESFTRYGHDLGIRVATVYGGVRQGGQVQALQAGVDVVVATPGRLLDLMGQGYLRLDMVDTFVLDEGDRMLDMGFINDIRRVVRELPKARQTLMFSATMPPAIKRLAETILKDPVEVRVAPPAATVDLTEQQVLFVEKPHKIALLVHTLKSPGLTKVLAFTRTRHGAERVVGQLIRAGINAVAIHGDKSQGDRTRALEALRAGEAQVLVATDVASRGLDIEGITHVVNFDLPSEPEAYVHRIGRTGRAGRPGVAVSFCSVEEREELGHIERLIGKHLLRREDQPFLSPLGPAPQTPLRRGSSTVNGPRSARGGGSWMVRAAPKGARRYRRR